MESFKMPINPNPLEKQPIKEPQLREGAYEKRCPECGELIDEGGVCHTLSCDNLNKRVSEPIVTKKEEEEILEVSHEDILNGAIPTEKIHDLELSVAADKTIRELVDFTNPEFYKVGGTLNYEKTKNYISSAIEKEIHAQDINTPAKIIEFMETLVSYGGGLLNSRGEKQIIPEREEIIQMAEKALRAILENKKKQFRDQRLV